MQNAPGRYAQAHFACLCLQGACHNLRNLCGGQARGGIDRIRRPVIVPYGNMESLFTAQLHSYPFYFERTFVRIILVAAADIAGVLADPIDDYLIAVLVCDLCYGLVDISPFGCRIAVRHGGFLNRKADSLLQCSKRSMLCQWRTCLTIRCAAKMTCCTHSACSDSSKRR